MSKHFWSQEEAHVLCQKIHNVCAAANCHVALTGGCLYHDGERKDIDIQFYRMRQADRIDLQGLWAALESVGIIIDHTYNAEKRVVSPIQPYWLYKAFYSGKLVDITFPESTEPYNPDHES